MYYHNIWDPILIVSQMAVLQCGFYLSFGLFLFLFHLLLDTPLSLSLMLDGDRIDLTRGSGWTAIMAELCATPVVSFLILRVVGRAKKCLDFSSSLYFFHYLTCCTYGGIPSSWQFYLVLAITLTVTAVISELLCMKEEMKWIPTQGGGGDRGGGGGGGGAGSQGGLGGGGGGGLGGGQREGGGGLTGDDGLLSTSVGSALSRLSGNSPRLVLGVGNGGGGGGEVELSIGGGHRRGGTDEEEEDDVDAQEKMGLLLMGSGGGGGGAGGGVGGGGGDGPLASSSMGAVSTSTQGQGNSKGRLPRFKPL